MPQKKDQTTYAVANNLKTAMQSKGVYDSVMGGYAIYDAGGSEQHLALFDVGGGSFRSIAKSTSSMWFDFINTNDTALVRIWTYQELYNFIGTYPGISRSYYTKSGNNYTHTIVLNGQTYQATDSNEANAVAICFTNALNAN